MHNTNFLYKIKIIKKKSDLLYITLEIYQSKILNMGKFPSEKSKSWNLTEKINWLSVASE